MVMGQCWLSARLFFGGQHSRRDVGLLPRLHGTAALSMVMVSAGFLQPPEYGGARGWLANFGPERHERKPELVRN